MATNELTRLHELAESLRRDNPTMDAEISVDDCGVWLRFEDEPETEYAMYATVLGGGIVRTLEEDGTSHLRRPCKGVA